MRFHLALRLAAHAAYRQGQITGEQRDQVLETCNQFGTGQCLQSALEDLVTQRAQDDGVAAYATVGGKIDWASILQFLQGLMPLILQFISILHPVVPKP